MPKEGYMPKPMIVYMGKPNGKVYQFLWDGGALSDVSVTIFEGKNMADVVSASFPAEVVMRSLASAGSLLTSPASMLLHYQTVCDNWMVTREKTLEALDEEAS